jgi:electron transfer flavoprotein alpha subunit
LADQGIALENARIVIGGGRGLDEAGFAQLERIANALGGAVAASLPAVDLGFAPVSRQVGQSGKFVTPQIYVAVGMSGTPQHLAGIGSATRIITVNTDADAPIFRVAETGVVADARILLPLLSAALESMNGETA